MPHDNNTASRRDRSSGGGEDIFDVFRAIAENLEGDTDGAPAAKRESIPKESAVRLLVDGYGIDADVASIDDVFGLVGVKGSDINKEDMERLLKGSPDETALPSVRP
jgi:hypothetical protein